MAEALVTRLIPFVNETAVQRLPDAVVHDLSLRILDTLGICFATYHQPYAQALTNVVTTSSASGQCTIVGCRKGYTPAGAAFANGVLSHGAEMDDCHIPSITHAGSTSLPAVLAAAEDRGVSGADCLAAAAVAYELLPRVSFAAQGKFHERGLQTTSMCAPLVNALAVGKLLRLNDRQLINAAGLAGALAGGLRTGNDDGSWTKRLFGGWAAQVGVTAAQLAANDFTGPREILEARFGLYKAHLGDIELNLGALTDGLGSRWETLNTSFRRYPCSFGLHATIECCLKLREKHKISLADIEKVECRLPKPAARWWFEPEAEKRRPPTPYAAMFSIPFVAGAALAHGEVTVGTFEESNLRAPDILEVIDKSYWTPDEITPFPGTMPGWVVLHMKNGSTLEHRQIHEPGSPHNPLSEDELFRKFRENTRPVLTKPAARKLWDQGLALRELPDVREFLSKYRFDGNRRAKSKIS